MAPSKCHYFVPPDFLPPHAIRLGQLFVDINDPGMSLADDGPLKLPSYGVHIEHMPTSVVQNYSASASTAEIETGIFFKAMQYFMGRAKLAYDSVSFESKLHNIDKLHTQTIFPTDRYVEDSLRQPQVQQHLQRHMFRKNVFMVTGVKIAKKGAQIKEQSGGAQERSVDMTAEGGSESIGAGGTARLGSGTCHFRGNAFVADADFVYAFQARKCHFGSHGVTKSVYTKNAVLAGEALQPAEYEAPPEMGEIVVRVFNYYGIDDEDATTAAFGLDESQYHIVDDSAGVSIYGLA